MADHVENSPRRLRKAGTTISVADERETASAATNFGGPAPRRADKKGGAEARVEGQMSPEGLPAVARRKRVGAEDRATARPAHRRDGGPGPERRGAGKSLAKEPCQFIAWD